MALLGPEALAVALHEAPGLAPVIASAAVTSCNHQ